jgi:phosphoserine aminotransferase
VNGPWGGEETSTGILTIDAKFDGVTVMGGVPVFDQAALRDAELFANQVDSSDFFRNGVFDL